MASVSQLVEAVSLAANETKRTVNAYARALIDAELLPKSSGRAVAQVEIVHFVRLITAIALKPKIRETAEMTASYLSLYVLGRNSEGNYVSGGPTAEDDLIRLFSKVLFQETDKEKMDLPKRLVTGKIQFVRNFPMIEIEYLDSRHQSSFYTYTTRHKPLEHDQTDDGHLIRRSAIVQAHLIVLAAALIDPINWRTVFAEVSSNS